MRRSHYLILVLGAAVVILIHSLVHPATRASSPSSPSKSSSSLGATSSPVSKLAEGTLRLPFEINYSQSKQFGFYPFGLTSSEHPAGHRGFNFEVKPSAPVLAPADMRILFITSPLGRPDEHNVTAGDLDQPLKFEFLRVGKLEPSVKINSVVKAGVKFAQPGLNHSLGITMFHFGILNKEGLAICPDQSLWQPQAWQSLNQLRQTSKDSSGKPYTEFCTSTSPLPPGNDE